MRIISFIQTLTLSTLATFCAGEISAQISLTDVTVGSADASGTQSQGDVWDTAPGGSYNLAVLVGGFSGYYVNGPADAQARPNVLLADGHYVFGVAGSPGVDRPYFNMNLFFNGAGVAGISVTAPFMTTPTEPAFQANSAAYTYYNNFNYGPGAGTLSFVSGQQTVTMTRYFWARPGLLSLDLTGHLSLQPDSENDYLGIFELDVVTVPEPSSAVLFGLAGLAAVLIRRRKSIGP
jgi:hypothetical protein